MIEAAFLAAFALILDLFLSIRIAPAVTVSISMLPIFIASLRWGKGAGILSGLIWGLLQVVTGNVIILSILQFFIEYFIAFAFVGFAGLFYKKVHSSLRKKKRNKAITWTIIAVFTGSIARYFWHFLAGIIYWGAYAPEGMSPFVYSFTINGAAMIGAATLSAIALSFLVKTAPRIISGV